MQGNKIIWILVVITVFNVAAFFLGKAIIEKAADRAIQKLQKEYSPSPYGPGFDPDRFNLNEAKVKVSIENVPQEVKIVGESQEQSNVRRFAEIVRWREEWERSRGD
jgi:hypothetical protein